MNTFMRAITAGKQAMNLKNRERLMDRFKGRKRRGEM